MPEKIYTLAEVADYLKVSNQTIYNYITAKKLKATKPGGRKWIIKEADLQTFINGKDAAV